MAGVRNININDTLFYECLFRAEPNYLSFTSTGVELYCYNMKTSSVELEKTWTYSGSGTFLGFATTSGGSVVYDAGDIVYVDNLSANLLLYSVEEVSNETYITSDTDLTSVANAIRTKGGTSASLVYPAGYISAINALPTGTLQSYKSAVFTSPGSATLTPDSGYIGIEEISMEYSPAIYDGAFHKFVVYPVKGDIINIDMNGDGTNEEYLVLKQVDTTVFEVLARVNCQYGGMFRSTNVYPNSGVDTGLNSNYYSSLSTQAKTAIVDKTFYPDAWYSAKGGSPVYVCDWNPNDRYEDHLSLITATYGAQITRHIYAPSIQDIVDYLEITTSMTKTNTTGTGANLRLMFNSTTNSHIWTRSLANKTTDTTHFCNYIDLSAPTIGSMYSNSTSYSLRPMFQIDLSKIGWSFVS